MRFKLEGHTVVPVGDFMEWAEWFDKADRRIKQETVGKYFVSTVFLGLDHQFGGGAPLLFETMVFAEGESVDCERCSTWEEAEIQHAAMATKLTLPSPATTETRPQDPTQDES